MRCNNLISLRVLVSIILSVFFLLVLVTASASADDKIGLDLEWRPIKGVEKPPPAPEPGSSGKTWTDPVTGMQFVWVPGGCYRMGCGSWAGNCDSDEKPVHEVCLDGFWMGKHEVTQGEWEKVMRGNPSHFKNGKNFPVERVSWNDCQKFIDRLNGNSRGNYKFRLPMEAEWEYACRSGGKSEEYAGGSDVDRLAWYDKNSGGRTHEVGTKSPNGLEIYDMSGNVWEWCEDWKSSYKSGSDKNPTGPATGTELVIRGGGWGYDARNDRCGNRLNSVKGNTNGRLGFRLVRTN